MGAQLYFFVLPFIDFQAIFFFFSFQFVFCLIQEQNSLSLSLSHSVGFTIVFCCVGEGKSLAELHDRVEILHLLLYRKFFMETKCGLFLFLLAGGISIGGMVVVFMLFLLLLHL